MNTRRGVLTAWLSVAGLTAVTGLTSAAGMEGLTAPSVCISPLVFLLAVATPPETLANIAAEKLGVNKK